ncbi:MAG TPA: hypothetical protein V6C97_06395 [Oculatellaceae cyanobacterium]
MSDDNSTDTSNIRDKQSVKSKALLWILGTSVVCFLGFGGACAFIAYDNRTLAPTDTPEEHKAHLHELKVVLTESFIGGGILGVATGVLTLVCLGKVKLPGINSDKNIED